MLVLDEMQGNEQFRLISNLSLNVQSELLEYRIEDLLCVLAKKTQSKFFLQKDTLVFKCLHMHSMLTPAHVYKITTSQILNIKHFK